MKFKFCGDLDCPDWVLVQIGLLSKLTSIRIKVICNEIAKNFPHKNLDFEKIEKISSDSKIDVDDVKSCLAALHFILTSASKYHVNSETLSSELQQLGLPKEHTTSLCKVYLEFFDQFQNGLKSLTLRKNNLTEINWEILSNFSSSSHKITAPTLRLAIRIKSCNSEDVHQFFISPDKINTLIYELKQAQQMMNEFSN